MPSPEYDALSKKMNELEKQFIGRLFSSKQYGRCTLRGVFPPQIKERIRSFCVIMHAELEYYFELKASQILDYGTTKFNTNTNHQLCATIFSYSVGEIRKTIKNNHGIKKDNVKKIYGPLGVDLNSVDPLLTTELENFGTTRSGFAHSSIGIIQLTDPKDEVQKVKQLVTMLVKFDAEVSRILAT